MKSNRARQVVAVIVVATALCADRAALNAAPLPAPTRTQSRAGNSLGRIVDRLTQGFRRDVRIDLSVQAVRAEALSATLAAFIERVEKPAHQAFSPFQFRLPPPLA